MKSNRILSTLYWSALAILVFFSAVAYFEYLEISSKKTSVSKIENKRSNLDTQINSKNTQKSISSENENSIIEENQELLESEYKGNQLKNGSSPFDECFGKGVYSGNATLTIKNGSGSDAIVCLYSISLDRTIRNEYVQKNSNFTMDNIAQGSYKIRVFFGNDWNPTCENACGTKGDFDSDVDFSEFDQKQFFEDNEDGYTVATITLYAVRNGNASTSRINRTDFFKK
jgi:hypothetical protein